MPPENIRFGGGLSATLLHPLVLIAMLVAIGLIFFLPRRHVIIPLLFCGVLIPLSQQVVIGGLHLMVIRILILAGLFRMFGTKLSSGGELLAGGFTSLDKAFLIWAVYRAVAPVILFMQMPVLVNSFGFVWDVFGGYFLLRFLIHDDEDVRRVVKSFVWIAAIVAVCMVNEKLRMQNVFGFLGGFRIIPEVREGAVRAQGPFAISIIGGTFGATLLPLFFALWKVWKNKVAAIIGVIASTIMVWGAASSTPVLAYGGAILVICIFPLRKSMRKVRWGIVLALVGLQIVMKAPVWFVITHFELVGGSSNYHRAELIDQFVNHFSSWWLIGVKDSGSWGWDMWDLANQFVAEGEVGGLVSLVSFIAMISICFKWLGKARKAIEGDRAKEWYFWLLGAAVFSNVVAFFGISYFDQSRFYWFALLAMVPAATCALLADERVSERESISIPAGPLQHQPSYSSQRQRQWNRNSPLLHRQGQSIKLR